MFDGFSYFLDGFVFTVISVDLSYHLVIITDGRQEDAAHPTDDGMGTVHPTDDGDRMLRT